MGEGVGLAKHQKPGEAGFAEAAGMKAEWACSWHGQVAGEIASPPAGGSQWICSAWEGLNNVPYNARVRDLDHSVGRSSRFLPTHNY